MPAGLDNLQNKIWAKLRGKINPRTRKPYTESESWAIATAQWKKSKRLAVCLDENYEYEPDILEDTIRELEEG